MLVTSHKNSTIPSAGKGSVCKCVILKMHMPMSLISDKKVDIFGKMEMLPPTVWATLR